MFSVSRIRAHGTPLSQYKMFQLQQVWSCCSRLFRQNTSTGTPAQHRKHSCSMRHHTRSTSCHNQRDKHRFNRSRSHSHSHRYRSHSQSNSQRSHSRSYHRHPHRSTSHHKHSNTYHHQWDTTHRRSSSHISSSAHSRDCSRSKPCTSHKTTCMTSSKPSYSSNKTAWKQKYKKYKQVTIDDPPSNYYSSDEPSSESEEDLN